MKTKILNSILILSVMASVGWSQQVLESKSDMAGVSTGRIEIYLPREVVITDGTITLDKVAILRGFEPLVASAGQVILGHISSPSQQFLIDKATIMSRLACSGISRSKVKFSGAKKITVRQQQQTIEGNRILEAAHSFLMNNLSDTSVCKANPTRMPKNLALAVTGTNVALSPRLISRSRNHVKVEVGVVSNGIEIATREVSFRLKYNCRRIVTLSEFGPGTVVTAENTRIEQAASDYPEPADWSAPYGLVAKRRLPANTILSSDMVTRARPEAVIERNQTVIVKIDRPFLSLTAMGRAMQKGRVGDCIRVKVQITNTPRTIMAKVNQDGSVEPVF